MVYDESRTEHHLTPRGFESGDPPPDRVETWVRDMCQASGYSREQVSWTCKWADPNVSRATRDELRDKHKGFMGSPGRSGGRWGRDTMIGKPL